jgi:hypothetical protein
LNTKPPNVTTWFGINHTEEYGAQGQRNVSEILDKGQNGKFIADFGKTS